MALDQATLAKLIGYLEQKIKGLSESQVSLERLQKDSTFADATERRLQTAIEAIINISEHIVAGLNLAHPDTAKDAILTLAKEHIITQGLADNLAEASDMRNVLVHLYTEVKLENVAEAATVGLDDLKEFAKQIHSFLKKQKPSQL